MDAVPPPLSTDLRARIICAREAGSTYEECAEEFLVSRSTVDRLIHRHRETGSVSPKAHAGGRPWRIPRKALHVLTELVEDKPDTTRGELRKAIKASLGIEVSTATIGRELRRLKLTLKKKTV